MRRMSRRYRQVDPGRRTFRTCQSEGYNEIQFDMGGYDPDHFMEMALIKPGENLNDPHFRRSYVCKIVANDINKFINLPVLKHHQSAGVTIALKEHVARHGEQRESQPSDAHFECLRRFHPVGGEPAGDSRKGRATYLRRREGAYHGGPPGRPKFMWEHKTMYFCDRSRGA